MYRPESSQTLSRPLTLKTVEAVFDRLKGQFGAKLADMWAPVLSAPPARDERGNILEVPNIVEREWMEGLAGFQRHELQRGCDACSDGRIFPPTLGEFKLLCRPCLDPEYAWHEARECLKQRDAGQVGDWTHPAVFFAAVGMSAEVRSDDWRRHKVKWTRNLHGSLSKGWRQIPPVKERVEEAEHVPVPAPETTKMALERARLELAEKTLKQSKENEK